MAQRPGPGDPRGSSDDSSDWGWIYGDQAPADPDATRAIPRQPRADESDDRTRVMPTQQPSPRSQPAPHPAPQPTPQPAPQPVRPAPLARRRRRRPRLRWLLLLVLAWVVFLVAVPLYAWSQVDKVAFEPSGERPGEQPGTTYLLVGSDSRGGLTPAQRRELGTGDAAGRRTDTILLLHTGSGPNLLMSIPRDSIVEIPGRGGTDKVNAAFAYGGPRLLVQTLESETGIRIDQYVEIGFGGFAGIVDAVGGVQICPREAMQDPLANLDVARGCQQADGATALGYARSRKLATLGDIDRARRQREVISAIGAQVLSPWTVLNPVRYWRINTSAADAVAVGRGMNPIQAAMWASAMTRVNGENGLTCGVPIADLEVNWDPERSQQMFQAIIDDDTASITPQLCTPTGVPR